MKRVYSSRTGPGRTDRLNRCLVSGVIEGESLEGAQASMDHVFRTRGLPDTHQAFAFQDLDEVRDPLGGILATNMMEAS